MKKVIGGIVTFLGILLICGIIFIIRPNLSNSQNDSDATSVKSNDYKPVTWNTDVNFTAGDCDTENYTGWCPHNLQYDKTRKKFVFLQSHSTQHLNGKFVEMTLCYLDPADPLKYEKLNCPYYEGLGALLVKDDGTWLIWTEDARYTSEDAGETWKKDLLATPLPTRYGVYDLDGILYTGDDSAERGVYRVSRDGGITWETKNFGVNYSDCEASFCKFKGNTYAFLRTNEADYACIMKETEDGWEIVNDDTILAYASNCSPVVFDDCIAIAHVNRKDSHLYYTVWDGGDQFETTDLGLIEASSGYERDFHSPALAFGNGYACIAFMMHMYGTPTPEHFWYAQNSWVIGTYDDRDLFTCKTQQKFENTEQLTEELTEIYPSDTDQKNISITSTKINNNTNHAVSLYSKNDIFENCTMSSEKGFIVPVKNGNLAAYGTKTSAIDRNAITIEMLEKYQPYCVLAYEGSNYMCVYNSKSGQMMSLQRKNYLYESSLVTNCIDTNDVKNICYILAYSSMDLNDEIQTVVIDKK